MTSKSATTRSLKLPNQHPKTTRTTSGARVTPGVIVAGVLLCVSVTAPLAQPLPGKVVYETTSAYHHIRVIDHMGLRTLSFDDSRETRMSLANPLSGHFEYTEYFHAPWLWNTNIKAVLMIGLGGGSVQRSYAHYHPDVVVDTAEIDPVVFRVAREYFRFQESPRQRVYIEDGRVFIRRSQADYDVVIVDAYVQSRYGSALPYHLATREFFELVKGKLTTNGVVAFNCMGTLTGWQSDLVGAIYQTMKAVYPRAYLFPARDSLNVVLLATRTEEEMTAEELRTRASKLVRNGRVRLPGFIQRVTTFRSDPPRNFLECPVLIDDYAPIDGLLCDRTKTN